MFSNLKLWVVAALAIGLIVAGAAPAWYIQGLRWKSNVASIQQANTAALKIISDAAQVATAQALTQQQAAENNAAAIDAKYQQDLADAKNTNDSLRSAVSAGTSVLHVNASCPSNTGSGNAVPNKSTTVSSANAASPTLAGDAEQNYFTLIDELNQMQAQITGLQAYAKSVSRGAAK